MAKLSVKGKTFQLTLETTWSSQGSCVPFLLICMGDQARELAYLLKLITLAPLSLRTNSRSRSGGVEVEGSPGVKEKLIEKLEFLGSISV